MSGHASWLDADDLALAPKPGSFTTNAASPHPGWPFMWGDRCTTCGQDRDAPRKCEAHTVRANKAEALNAEQSRMINRLRAGEETFRLRVRDLESERDRFEADAERWGRRLKHAEEMLNDRGARILDLEREKMELAGDLARERSIRIVDSDAENVVLCDRLSAAARVAEQRWLEKLRAEKAAASTPIRPGLADVIEPRHARIAGAVLVAVLSFASGALLVLGFTAPQAKVTR